MNSETIYISRRCKYCHELLILLHKNKDIINIPVVDIDTNAYPKLIKSVPCMVIDNKILPGVELFKFINYLIKENSDNNDTSRSSNTTVSKNTNGQTNINEQSITNNKSNTNDKSSTNGPIPDKNDNEINGFCFGGSCNLGYASIDDNDYDNHNYEMLNSDESSKSCNIDNSSANNTSINSNIDLPDFMKPISTKKDKGAEFDNRLKQIEQNR